jgi:hypothetical protein
MRPGGRPEIGGADGRRARLFMFDGWKIEARRFLGLTERICGIKRRLSA